MWLLMLHNIIPRVFLILLSEIKSFLSSKLTELKQANFQNTPDKKWIRTFVYIFYKIGKYYNKKNVVSISFNKVFIFLSIQF